MAGFIVVKAGYSAAFLTLAAVAARGFLLYLARHAGDLGRREAAAGPAPEAAHGRPPRADRAVEPAAMLNEQLPRDQGWVRACVAAAPAAAPPARRRPRLGAVLLGLAVTALLGRWPSPPSPPAASCRPLGLHLPRVAAVAGVPRRPTS